MTDPAPEPKRTLFEDVRWKLHEIAGDFRRMNDFRRAARVQKIADEMWKRDGRIIPQPIIPRSHHG